MSAHILWNILNELGKRDKLRGFPSILSIFRNEFYTSNKYRCANARLHLSHDIKNT